MNQEIYSVAPVQPRTPEELADIDRAISSLNEEEINKYWVSIFSKEELEEDETARIVFQAKLKKKYIDPNSDKKHSILLTEATQIRSATDVFNYMALKINDLPKYDCGVSIGSSIFKYTGEVDERTQKVKAPSINTFKSAEVIVLDIDAHIHDSKERYPIYKLDKMHQTLVFISSYNILSKYLKDAGFNAIKPHFYMVSGGGIQIAFKFDKVLSKSEATTIYSELKNIFKKDRFNLIIKKYDSIEFEKIDLDIDATFADISHTQRMAGIPNQKYDYIPSLTETMEAITDDDFSNIFDFESPTFNAKIHNIHRILFTQIFDAYSNDEIRRKKLEEYFKSILQTFLQWSMDPSGVDNYINSERLFIEAKMKTYDSSNDIKPVSQPQKAGISEYTVTQKASKDILKVLHKGEIPLSKFFPSFEFQDCGTYYKTHCPFHEEKTPSMAFYQNTGIFKDFHDSKSYNIVEMYQAINNLTPSQAILETMEIAGLKVNKELEKASQKEEIEAVILEKLNELNQDGFEFVYYRLSNNSRKIIARDITTGESFSFDKLEILTSHILKNRLNLSDVEDLVKKIFDDLFEKKVLIDAFEEFYPGKETTYTRGQMSFVNMWVPSKNYKKVHERAENQIKEFKAIEEYAEANKKDITELDGFARIEKDKIVLPDAIKHLQETCPYTYLYIQQMTQKGNLPWFINWMASTAQFQIVPTIPVVYGIGGAGKNLFINTIMEWYLNSEYVKVFNADRLMSNFNSSLETCSLLVLDEGDFSSSSQMDQLKLITGNDKIAIERKGVDTVIRKKFFNVIFFSNGDIPMRHPALDRRITYFNNELTLLETLEAFSLDIDTFIEKIQEELPEFWATLVNIKLNDKMTRSNHKDGMFTRQILKMHPFGDFMLKVHKGEWEDITLQLNENVLDENIMVANNEMIREIRAQFNSDGSLPMTIINRYMASINFKFKTSIQKFIRMNNFEKYGITHKVRIDGIPEIFVDRDKFERSTTVENEIFRYKNARDILAADRKEFYFENLYDIFMKDGNPDKIYALDLYDRGNIDMSFEIKGKNEEEIRKEKEMELLYQAKKAKAEEKVKEKAKVELETPTEVSIEENPQVEITMDEIKELALVDNEEIVPDDLSVLESPELAPPIPPISRELMEEIEENETPPEMPPLPPLTPFASNGS